MSKEEKLNEKELIKCDKCKERAVFRFMNIVQRDTILLDPRTDKSKVRAGGSRNRFIVKAKKEIQYLCIEHSRDFTKTLEVFKVV